MAVSKKGYIYLVSKVHFRNVYKIGCTVDLKTRLQRMKLTYKSNMKYHYKFFTNYDYEGLEIKLHTELIHNRIRGDWFYLENLIKVDEICKEWELCQGNDI